MSLELIKEAVRFKKVVGEDSTQVIFENDIIVPDVKPDVLRILLLDGEAYVKDFEARHGGIFIEGAINFKIIYLPDEEGQTVKSINTSAPFHHIIELPETRQGMDCKVKCRVEHMECDLVNSRKINVKTILGVSGKVTKIVEEGISCDVDKADDSVQLLKKRIGINSFSGGAETTAEVKDIMEVPAGKPSIDEILRMDVKVTEKDYKLIDDKVTVEGELSILTLYIGDDENRSLQVMEHALPFSQTIDLPGVNENSSCRIDIRIVETSFEATEDSDGELRMLDGSVAMAITAEAYGSKEYEIIEDAYSTGARLSLEVEPVLVEECFDERKTQVIIKDTIALDENSPDISEIFNVLGRPSIVGYRINEGKIDIDGVLGSNVLYLANSPENPVSCQEKEICFSHAIEKPGIMPGMSCEFDAAVDSCNYSLISSKEVEIRYVLSIASKVYCTTPIQILQKINEQPIEMRDDEDRPNIILYFVQKGDTLWNIAKKYRTTMEKIKKANELESDSMPNVGEHLLIPVE